MRNFIALGSIYITERKPVNYRYDTAQHYGNIGQYASIM